MRDGMCLSGGDSCGIMGADVLVRFISKILALSHSAEQIREVCMVTAWSVFATRARSKMWAVLFCRGV
jgi:hypothetical protein